MFFGDKIYFSDTCHNSAITKNSDKFQFSDDQEKQSPRSMIEPAEITFACILIVFFDPVPEYSQNVLLGTLAVCSVIERRSSQPITTLRLTPLRS